VFDAECREHRYIEGCARDVAHLYGFEEVMTPVLERTNVFSRTLGDESDVVGKEMYTFVDKSNESLSLRPESTAGVMRALLHSRIGKLRSRPEKLFYSGPMFRRERPQKGRLRQFHQIGVELCGSHQAAADVEVILLGEALLQTLGLETSEPGGGDDGKKGAILELQVNTLGDAKSRASYETALAEYFMEHKEELSGISRDRLDRGAVLRILDSKESKDRVVVDGAPGMDAYLTAAALGRFEEVCDGLRNSRVPFVVNSRLVRGLDYYSHTAFEFVVSSSCGVAIESSRGQAVLAGGRYDGLSSLLGAKRKVDGVGWAMGTERAQLLRRDLGLADSSDRGLPSIVVAAVRPSADSDVSERELQRFVDHVCNRLRSIESPAWRVHRQFEVAPMSKLFKQATKTYEADALVVVGERELRSGDGCVSIKNFRADRLDISVPLEHLVSSLSMGLMGSNDGAMTAS